MRKLLNATLLSAGLIINTPVYATGMAVTDSISNFFDGISASVDEAMKTVTTKWQEFMQSNAGKTLEQVEKTVEKVQGVTNKVQEVYDKAYSYMNDPVGSVKSLALGKEKTKAEQYLPDSYTDESIKTFQVGKADTAIKESAETTLSLIKQEPSTFSFRGDKTGDFEKNVKDRDAREAAYYLAMTEEAYFQASQRYENLSKDYEQKLKNAHEVKDKLNLQNELQSKQLVLQSQLIQLKALEQTHMARKEVADERKKQLQKNKLSMKQISVL